MDIETLELLRSELEDFARDFDDCVKTSPSGAHLRRYLAGQLSDLPRKTVEAIAQQAGIPPRTLQQYLATYKWNEDAIVGCLQRRVVDRHGHPQAIALIDETSFAKKSDRTPGVQRQHCESTGRVADRWRSCSSSRSGSWPGRWGACSASAAASSSFLRCSCSRASTFAWRRAPPSPSSCRRC